MKVIPTFVDLGLTVDDPVAESPDCHDMVNVTGVCDQPPSSPREGWVWVCGWCPVDGSPLQVQIPVELVPPPLPTGRPATAGQHPAAA